MAQAARRFRGSNRVCALAIALLPSLLLCAAAGARPTRHRPCPPPGAHVLAGDRLVRVYSTGGPASAGSRTEACLRERGTRMTLIAPSGGRPRLLGRSLGEIALAGPIVAYLESQFGVDSGCDSIVVVDVADRRVLRSLPSVACWVDAGFVRGEGVTDLLVGPHGSVAWILQRGTRSAPKTLLVYAAGVTGPVRLLDEGPDIGPTSLSLSRGTLSWRHAGVLRTAALPS